MISNVLRDLHFSLNQLPKLADDQYTGMLEKYNENLGIRKFFFFGYF